MIRVDLRRLNCSFKFMGKPVWTTYVLFVFCLSWMLKHDSFRLHSQISQWLVCFRGAINLVKECSMVSCIRVWVKWQRLRLPRFLVSGAGKTFLEWTVAISRSGGADVEAQWGNRSRLRSGGSDERWVSSVEIDWFVECLTWMWIWRRVSWSLRTRLRRRLLSPLLRLRRRNRNHDPVCCKIPTS